MFINSRERGREKEREKERQKKRDRKKYLLVASHKHPDRNPVWELTLPPSGVWDNAPTN